MTLNIPGKRPGGLPIFWQTLLILLAGVAVAQLIAIALFLSLPPPRPDFNRLTDIAESLAGRRIDREHLHMVRRGIIPPPPEALRPAPPAPPEPPRSEDESREIRDRALKASQRQTPPVADAGMTSDPRLTEGLAMRIGVPVDQVRLFFEPDQHSSNIPWFHRRDKGGVMERRGEPIFFDTVVAGLDTGHGWRVVRTPTRPLLAPWQRRMILLFAFSALALIPIAWLFARALARPIRQIADAADRMGANPQAPLIAEQGPAELRVTAQALNRMQERLSSYLAERTNMIGAIAHDLRTPLARIAFRIEGAPEEMREKVQSDIEQMRQMIAATISFVRETGSIAAVAVALHQLLGNIAEGEEEVGRPVTRGAIAPAIVLGDQMALRRLFQNLIDNGVAYGGGVEIGVKTTGDEAEIRFSDRGPGLSESALEAMFKPFERGEPSRNRKTGGIGLGLSIARAIAQEHGGSLILANRDGGGLEAICKLPLRA